MENCEDKPDTSVDIYLKCKAVPHVHKFPARIVHVAAQACRAQRMQQGRAKPFLFRLDFIPAPLVASKPLWAALVAAVATTCTSSPLDCLHKLAAPCHGGSVPDYYWCILPLLSWVAMHHFQCAFSKNNVLLAGCGLPDFKKCVTEDVKKLY